jgi:hypothetical protein
MKYRLRTTRLALAVAASFALGAAAAPSANAGYVANTVAGAKYWCTESQYAAFHCAQYATAVPEYTFYSFAYCGSSTVWGAVIAQQSAYAGNAAGAANAAATGAGYTAGCAAAAP